MRVESPGDAYILPGEQVPQQRTQAADTSLCHASRSRRKTPASSRLFTRHGTSSTLPVLLSIPGHFGPHLLCGSRTRRVPRSTSRREAHT